MSTNNCATSYALLNDWLILYVVHGQLKHFHMWGDSFIWDHAYVTTLHMVVSCRSKLHLPISDASDTQFSLICLHARLQGVHYWSNCGNVCISSSKGIQFNYWGASRSILNRKIPDLFLWLLNGYTSNL